MVMIHTHAKGQGLRSVGLNDKEWKKTDGQTNGWTEPTALPPC